MKLTGPESEQGSDAWRKYRADKITASEIGIIIGVSPFSTPLELWKRKLGFILDQEQNYAMKRGNDLEPMIRNMVNESLERNFIPEVHICESLEWAMASLDGIDHEYKEILEIKTASQADHKEVCGGNIPEKYLCQMQWQMMCSDCETGHYASYHMKTKDLVVFKIHRDDDYIINRLLPNAVVFYENLTKFIPPALSEKDYVEVYNNDLFEESARKWKAAHEMAVFYAEKERCYKEKLISLTDDSNTMGYGIRLTRINREGSIDWKKFYSDLEKNYPDIAKDFSLESYRKEQIGYWKISEDNK